LHVSYGEVVSRGTCARCLGSRRRFKVNMGFTDDNRILIEILYIKKLIKLIKLEQITELFE